MHTHTLTNTRHDDFEYLKLLRINCFIDLRFKKYLKLTTTSNFGLTNHVRDDVMNDQ